MHRKGWANGPVVSALKQLQISVCCFVLFTSVILGNVSSIASHDGASLGNSSPNTSMTSQPETPHSEPQCIYTQWSHWSGYCPPPTFCGSSIQRRTRYPDGNIDRCTDIMQQRNCKAECVNIRVTTSLLVLKMRDNSALGKEENTTSSLSYTRYTYGSLFDCFPGCSDIKGLDRDHEFVCVTCMNEHSCERAGALHLMTRGNLNVVRNKRKGNYAVKVDGEPCSCSFIPKVSLMDGICGAPSYYINFTVL